jgi:uncharacterized protein (DUF433 family)
MDIAPINHIEIRDGQPMIRGRRVKVRMVASMHIHAGAPIEEVMEQYNISEAEVYAALAYYYDNREAFEAEFREAEKLLKEIGTPIEEAIARIKARSQKKNE